ncbi:hypothetical protein JCM3766R1_004625 [Sporobolomyces carnicolor]
MSEHFETVSNSDPDETILQSLAAPRARFSVIVGLENHLEREVESLKRYGRVRLPAHCELFDAARDLLVVVFGWAQQLRVKLYRATRPRRDDQTSRKVIFGCVDCRKHRKSTGRGRDQCHRFRVKLKQSPADAKWRLVVLESRHAHAHAHAVPQPVELVARIQRDHNVSSPTPARGRCADYLERRANPAPAISGRDRARCSPDDVEIQRDSKPISEDFVTYSPRTRATSLSPRHELVSFVRSFIDVDDDPISAAEDVVDNFAQHGIDRIDVLVAISSSSDRTLARVTRVMDRAAAAWLSRIVRDLRSRFDT